MGTAVEMGEYMSEERGNEGLGVMWGGNLTYPVGRVRSFEWGGSGVRFCMHFFALGPDGACLRGVARGDLGELLGWRVRVVTGRLEGWAVLLGGLGSVGAIQELRCR